MNTYLNIENLEFQMRKQYALMEFYVQESRNSSCPAVKDDMAECIRDCLVEIRQIKKRINGLE